MNSASIRTTFLEFFAERGHTVVPSSSLIPDDPTLLLTNAGMNQFKPYFLGQKEPPYPRAASVQKCFRETDLEEVGKTARHFTLFEMLGNFSFGDYFKSEACRFAWDLMTGGYGLEPDRLWATVYVEDDEAARIWREEVGVPAQRILRRTREDGNFWDMGVAGPCGPCSELLYDRGPAFGTEYTGEQLDEERYLEVWNLVFMQNVMNDKGEVIGDLPRQNIDTGMGLERLASILQGVGSNFEIDTVAPILNAAELVTGHFYGQSPETDVSLRVIAEHSRSMSFLIADGVLPGNIGRGYVLRRLIRRAVRYARLAGITQPVLQKMTGVVVDAYAGAYPELARNSDLIASVTGKEEARFDMTLRQGLTLLEEEISNSKAAGGRPLEGETVFKLHDTYGFPLDLTMDIASDEGLEVDRVKFDELMKSQRERARAARGGQKDSADRLVLAGVLERSNPTDYLAHTSLETHARVVAAIASNLEVAALEEGNEGEIVLDRTSFYAEGGGQVGDRGEIRTATGSFLVEDTQWGAPGLIVHKGRIQAGAIRSGQEAIAVVEGGHRTGVRQSHTATHVVHWALRDTLGEHAKQQGSLVEPGRMRFDFSHYEPVGDERLAEIEEEINRKVLVDDQVRAFETTFDAAMELGATALFGEKYGDVVRVVEVGDYSRELCGGTHVFHTGEIGIIKFTREGSVAAGVRRVEALTGLAGLAHLNSQAETLRRAAEMLKTDPEKVLERLERTMQQIKSLETDLNRYKAAGSKEELERILESGVEKVGSRSLIVFGRTGPIEEARRLAIRIRDRLASGIVVVGSADGAKGAIAAAATRDLVDAGVSAGELIAESLKLLGGGGSRQPDLAVGGGPEGRHLNSALEEASSRARSALERLG